MFPGFFSSWLKMVAPSVESNNSTDVASEDRDAWHSIKNS
jgi:hypothetical protein